jgi:L-fuculose-phosphate aldolase
VACEEEIRGLICDIGRRMYEKDFIAANDGNISVRIDEDRFLCTPTDVSKGFMKPEMIAVVDGQGRQIEGPIPRTSEIFMHLEIYKALPHVRAVAHAHPPHATAYAITDAKLPSGILPEVEVLLGEVPVAAYDTPGTKSFAQNLRPHLKQTVNTILLSNHGVVAFDQTLEKAYFHLETLEMYCRILLIGMQIGNIRPLGELKMRELLESKRRMGLADDRCGG